MTEHPGIEDLIRQLISDWLTKGIAVNNGTTEEAIVTFENQHDVRIPADFRKYLLLVNGMQPYEMDGLSSLWPLDSFISLPRRLGNGGWDEPGQFKVDNDRYIDKPVILEPSKCFLFEDYNIQAGFWVINLSKTFINTPIYMIYDEDYYVQVADCFYHFLDQYISDCPEALI